MSVKQRLVWIIETPIRPDSQPNLIRTEQREHDGALVIDAKALKFLPEVAEQCNEVLLIARARQGYTPCFCEARQDIYRLKKAIAKKLRIPVTFALRCLIADEQCAVNIQSCPTTGTANNREPMLLAVWDWINLYEP